MYRGGKNSEMKTSSWEVTNRTSLGGKKLSIEGEKSPETRSVAGRSQLTCGDLTS
jgi:hypothetical protein